MTNSSLIAKCTEGLKVASNAYKKQSSMAKEAAKNKEDLVLTRLREKLASRLQQKEACGNPANIALARKCRPGLFPGLRDSPIAFDDPHGLLSGIRFDPKSVEAFRTPRRG